MIYRKKLFDILEEKIFDDNEQFNRVRKLLLPQVIEI
jgi:hypothetical protein